MTQEERKVQFIPSVEGLRFAGNAVSTVRKRRVAGYARVSTDQDEQLTSYEAQIDYYTNYIKSRSDWEFVKVYTDEGISATNTKKRDGFNQMISDALSGKIDLIITKSVSRFARNTVDSLTTVRKLKEKGVEIYFEKENIWTLDSKGELLITIMSSLAQEESRSISENVTWGCRKRFADGKVNLPYKHFLGYEKGEDGLPKIVEEEAKIIRLIYSLFIEGKTAGMIADTLTAKGIKTPGGKDRWQASTILSILKNEKYKGSALLQKQFTVDFLTKKRKANEGEVPQYYIETSHDPIIDPKDFDKVQAELARRAAIGKSYSSGSVFSAKVVCGDCGGYFGSKVWHSTSKYRRVIWQCNSKFKNEKKCSTPHFTEDELKEKFMSAYSRLTGVKEQAIEDCRIAISAITDLAAIDSEIADTTRQLEVLAEMSRRLISDNVARAQNQEEYQKRFDGLSEQYEQAQDKLRTLQEERQRRVDKRKSLERFIDDLTAIDTVTDFSESLFCAIVEKMTVFSDGKVAVEFKDGSEVEI